MKTTVHALISQASSFIYLDNLQNVEINISLNLFCLKYGNMLDPARANCWDWWLLFFCGDQELMVQYTRDDRVCTSWVLS